MQKLIFRFVAILVCVISGMLILLAQEASCPSDYEGFLAPRLENGLRGRVTEGGSGNRVRDEPSVDGAQLGILPPGTGFDVLDEPVCEASSSIIWWYVRSDDGLEGWTAEGLLPDEYFVEVVPVEEIPTATLTPSPFPTRAATSTPSPVPHQALDLPELLPINAENIDSMSLLDSVSGAGDMESLFFSPDMSYMFTVHGTQQGFTYANILTFPNMEPIMQGMVISPRYLPLMPPALFTADSRVMVTFPNAEDILFYHPGETEFFADHDSFRSVGNGVLTSDGILIVAYGVIEPPSSRRPWLCFYDPYGETYAPEDHLCMESDTGIGSIALLADEARFLAATANELRLYDLATGEITQTFPYGNGGVVIVPGTETDGQLPTVLIKREGFVLSVNLETGQERTYLNGQGLIAMQIIPNADGTQMIVVVPSPHISGDVLLIDMDTREILIEESLFASHDGRGFSSDGSLFYVDDKIYHTQSLEIIYDLRGDQHIIGFSPDGSMLFVWNTTDWNFEIYGVAA